MTSRGAPG